VTVTSLAAPPAEASDSAPSPALARRRAVRRAAAIGLVALLVVALVVAAGTGAVPLSPSKIVSIALDAVGLPPLVAFSDREALVFRQIRAPRVVLGALVGGALGASGVAMQGLLKNPLADAGLLGVSSGGALAAALGIVLGGSLTGGAVQAVSIPIAAFVGGLAAAVAVLRIGREGGRPSVTKVLLAGIGINALCGAALGWLHYAADESELRSLTFWTLGGLGGARWDVVGVAAAPLLACAIGVPLFARSLNVLALGDRDARHLGLRVEVVTRVLVALVALGVGAAVATSGIIGFVGLVVPHVLRLAIGPDHRGLAGPSVLLGAATLVLADTASRVAIAPEEMPVGVITAAIGAPVFLALLLRAPRPRVAS
jgi:iron complex transport system permease protein